ncbi:DUF397 domain-containing protein [Streptomyces sp. MMS24-I31]|uniref:DUF397 domain-containing protein n=1 Tax=Streptomyces sp. MMS24-I31 TaxID=3351563 RepID=UPI003896B2C8
MIRTSRTRDISEPAWFKSSYSSSGDGNDCVEIAMSAATVHIRDSKNTQGPRLALTPTAWADFMAFAGRG